MTISGWFHEIQNTVFNKTPVWLSSFAEKMLKPDDTIVSFNWDLILDRLLFGDRLSAASYGFGPRKAGQIKLLKPHGSLNWYEESQGRRIKPDLRFELTTDPNDDTVFAFRRFRSPKSKASYMPLIIPPVYNKDFGLDVFQETWRNSVADLSVAKTVVFLGYSLPDADLHARFILRCGFHNQVEGEIGARSKSLPATGPADVIVVNPDQGAANRIERAIGRTARCDWQPMPVSKWIEGRSGSTP
jgi:hypothetical protein